ncbi:MAG TPA: hypothetical protein VNA17_05205 [Pyrinomonadaceae bacterium]|nr:hypothetical protein [Pyrinomonadaceae bacterium]
MDSETKGHGKDRYRRKKRRVTVSEPKEDSVSTRQIVVVAVLAVLIIAALAIVLSTFEVPVMRRR